MVFYSCVNILRWLLEMSFSWNFPARASPSYEDPSKAEPSWNFFEALIKNYNQISKFSTSIMIMTDNQLHDHLYEFM